MGLQPKKSQAVRLQLLPCSSLAGPAATKISSSLIAVATLQLSCWTCRPKISSSQIAVAALQPSCWACRHKISSTQSAVAILQLSYWACYQKIQSSQLQLLPCSPLAGPAATKISSSQIAVATLQLSCWTCRPKNLKQSDCSCCPAALLLGLPPQKPQARRAQLLSCIRPATKKSKKVRLQLLPCSPLAVPTAKKSQVVRSQLLLQPS